MKPNTYDEEIVIVGAGPAGASAACMLAQNGHPALLIERETAACHKVCGEFLSIEAQAYLAHMGIDLDDLGASHISSIRLIHRGATAEVDLPFVARGLSRKVLDEALLQRAVTCGTRLVRGSPVRSIEAGGTGLRANVRDRDAIRTRSLFLATGKHDVRGMKRPKHGTVDDLIGFKAHYRLSQSQLKALEGTVEVVLFEGGYAGLQRIEGNAANLCLVVTRHCFDQAGKSWSGLLEHIGGEGMLLHERLQGAEPVFERPLSIFQIPYGFLHAPAPRDPEGLFRIGDQVAVIPSYTGEGMSIALHSGCLAASLYLKGCRTSADFHRQVRADITRQIRLASLLYEAGRWPRGQRMLLQFCRSWPGAMRYVAALTRMHETAIQRALLRP